MTLARKQRSTHEDWLSPLAQAYNRPDVARARELIDQAVARLHAVPAVRPAYGWSGGKDSQALRVVAEQAGVVECVLVISDLEYPAFLGWATDHMPWGCYVEARPLDMAWLQGHQDWLFPHDARSAGRWFKAVQHDGQRAYARATGIDALVLGRRRADGNHCGPGGVYRDRAGFLRVSPMFDWSHEDVLCVLGVNAMRLPPCYGWPRGFRVGTGPWPARQWTTSVAHGWSEVMAIDETVVDTAARWSIYGAQEALTCAD